MGPPVRAVGTLRCESPVTPRVPQVGSFGNGTALRGSAEVQLVAFLSCFRSFAEAARRHQAALRLLRRTLWTCRDLLALGLEVLGVSPGVPDALAFTIQTRRTEEPVTVTIVPAYRALGKAPPRPAPACSSLAPGPLRLLRGAVTWLSLGNPSLSESRR